MNDRKPDTSFANNVDPKLVHQDFAPENKNDRVWKDSEDEKTGEFASDQQLMGGLGKGDIENRDQMR